MTTQPNRPTKADLAIADARIRADLMRATYRTLFVRLLRLIRN